MTRTLVIDATVAKPPYSGVQLAAMQEAKAVSALAPDSLVFGTAEGFTPQPAWARNTLGRILWQQTVLPRITRKLDATALLSLAYTCPLRSKCPVILHVHDIIALDYPELCSSLNVLHMRMLLPSSIHRADIIVASTHYVAERLAARFPEVTAKTHIVNLGVDYDFFAASVPRLATLPDAPYFLFVGNLEPKKGLTTLLDAFGLIADKCNANLVLAGRVAWKSATITRQIAILKRRFPERIIVLGRVPAEQLPVLYQHATAFVFPSIEEGFGLPVLEAMAAGVPVIHSSHPAILEATGGNGLSFDKGNAAALADIMLHLLEKPEAARQLVLQGKHHAQAHPWSRWAEKVVDLL